MIFFTYLEDSNVFVLSRLPLYSETGVSRRRKVNLRILEISYGFRNGGGDVILTFLGSEHRQFPVKTHDVYGGDWSRHAQEIACSGATNGGLVVELCTSKFSSASLAHSLMH